MLNIQLNTIDDLSELADKLIELNKKYFDRAGSASKYKDMAAELASFSNGFQQAKQHLSESNPFHSALPVDSHQYRAIIDILGRLIDKLDTAAEFTDVYELLYEARCMNQNLRDALYQRKISPKQILVLSIFEKTEYTESLRSEIFINESDLRFTLKSEIEDKLSSCLLDNYKTFVDVKVPRDNFRYPDVSIEDSLDAWFGELVEKNSAEDLVSYLNILPPSDATRDSWRYALEMQSI